MLLALVSSLVPKLWVDLADWVEQGGSYLQDHFWLVVWSATVEVALACLIQFIARVSSSLDGPCDLSVCATVSTG